jgi:glycosyltransferase involved in cell wall biosynthesis
MSERLPLRLAVYSDHAYLRTEQGLYTDRALVLFLDGVAQYVERIVLMGQLRTELAGAHYRVPDRLEFVGLPSYPSLVHAFAATVAMLRSLGRFWRVLGEVDVVWLLGPHPLCLAFAALAAIRRKRVALGIRQDFPAYARSRYPGRRLVHLAADLLEGAYRLLSRRCPTVAVGPQVAGNYGKARHLLEISVSLVRDAQIADPSEVAARSWSDEPTVLSVGRLDTEKNPLLLADILDRLDSGRSWRLVVCGEGPLELELRERLRTLGVEERSELLGYLPIDGGLMDLYRSSDAFLHVSWTEGLPQVLLEAFAAGIPVVATSVGGVPDAVGNAALLVPPGDPDAAARALERLAEDPELRADLVRRGAEQVRGRTLEAESRRVARFLARLEIVPAGESATNP